ncbi:MAG: glycosyltransferase family 9 protein [Fibrobacterales bacterium]
MKSTPKILFYCLPGIGDAIMMTPALKELRSRVPDADITVLTMYRSVAQMVQKLPEVNTVLLWDFFSESLTGSLRFVWRLRKEKFDITIMGFPANRKEYSLLSLLIGGKIRLGHRYLRGDKGSLNFLYSHTVVKDPTLHNVHESLRLVQAIDEQVNAVKDSVLHFPLEGDDLVFGNHWVRSNLPGVSKIIGIHPGSSTLKNHSNKRWPRDHFNQLVEVCSKRGITVIVVGGPEEDTLKEYVAGQNGICLSGTTLPQTASVIKECDLFVSNDSGMMHLAASQDVPVIGIYGPTSAVYAAPYSKNSKVITSELSCAPCFEYSKKPLTCHKYGDYRCLSNISVDQVIAEIEVILAIDSNPGKDS